MPAPHGAKPSGKPLEMRSTPLSARGEPMIWLTGGALVVCLAMIIGLVGMIVTHGMTTFWPRPVEQVTLQDGSVFLGIRTAEDDEPARTLYRTGNRDIGREPFRWVSHADIASVETPPGAVMVEREAWSVWFGVPERAIEVIDGEQRVVAEGHEAVMAYYHAEHASARQRRSEIERLMRQDLGRVNREMERQRLRVRSVELDMQRTDRIGSPMPLPAFVGTAAGVLGLAGVGVAIGRRANGHSVSGRWVRVVRLFCFLGAFIGILGCLLHAPWRGVTMTEAELASLRDRTAQSEAELQAEYDRILATIREKEAIDARQRLIIVEPTEGRFAPARQIEPDNPIQLSQVVRIVDTNAMGTGQKVGVFLSRWWEFLSTRPREANTEGGVFPVIVGTVMLTLLLTITVTPLGVIAALYLREYAPQGIVTSTIRIAVNNLAGVPSIVYGVFGLGFFCYTVGAFVDAGPAPEVRLPPVWWWAGLGTTVAAMIMAYACGVWSRPVPGTEPSKSQIMLRRLGWALWTMTLVLAVTLVVRTPYFTGFFEARAADGSPTFGSRGMLWAALTLALLTLPVVIVSTEEAIASVPNSMREGSYGCGASKWQTLRRIVIPGALPGILTGAILAMARGAGEVAPLMLVGAVKLNQDLPISGEAPYLHLDRSFMHLGFHIYDLGFQSPDSQAARPLVWTTTLLLLAIVLALNLVAIIIRARLRARLTGSTV